MKKIYMAPQVEVEKIEVESMLSGSETDVAVKGTYSSDVKSLDKDYDDYDEEDIW